MFLHQSIRSLVLLLALGVCRGAGAEEPKRDHFGDPLPEGASARLGSLRFRHRSLVRIGDFTSDGKLLAASSGDNCIIFWDVASGREARRVPVGDLYEPRWFHLSADDKSLILADRFGEYRIIDAVSGAERLRLEPKKLDRRYLDVDALTISRDGKTAVTIYSSGVLVVWDLVDGKRLREFPFRNNLNRSAHKPIALTPDGKRLAAPHTDGSLHLLDVATGKELLAIEMPSAKPRKDSPIVEISPDGRCLAFGGSFTRAFDSPCKSISICDMKTGKRLREFSSKNSINEWIFTPDSRSLALCDAENIRIFDVSSGNETKTFRKPQSFGIVFSPNSRKLAIPSGACISLLDVATGRFLHSPFGHDWLIQQIHFFPDGKRLVSNSGGDMIVWDVLASRPIAAYRSGRSLQWLSVTADGRAIRSLDWIWKPSPKRTKIAGLNQRGLEKEEHPRPAGSETRTIYRWDLTTDRKEQDTVFSIPAACDWFVLSPDGRCGASVTRADEPEISLREIKSDKPAVLADLPDDSRIVEVLFSPDGRRLLLCSAHGAERVLDTATGQRVRDLRPDASGRRPAWTRAFAPDGRSVVLDDGQLRIREVASNEDRLQISLPKQSYLQSSVPVVSPNGRFLVLSCRDRKGEDIFAFSTATGKLLAHWRHEQGCSTALAFSLDSRLLATGDLDGTILLWKLPEDDGLPSQLSQEKAATYWRALGDDASHANLALARLAAAPAQAVPLIRARFQTAWQKPDGKQIARWIADLDDDAFKVREQATRELTQLGSDAADALRQALAKKPSPEAKRRIEGILDRLNKGGALKHLRELRALEVLERIGTPQAKELLRDLAGKPLSDELREEVQGSLRRMGDKP